MRIIVVGAGIIGLSVAVRLSERGATVEVLEAARPGGGLTSTTFAWLNAGFVRVDRAVWELRAGSIERWRTDNPGAAWLYPGGSLHLARDAADGSTETAWWADLRAWGESIRAIDPTELAALEPDLGARLAAWTLFERDGWVETDGAVDALLGRLQRAGGTVTAGMAARSVETAPRHARVLLADGTTRWADAVVVGAARATPELTGAGRVPLRPTSHRSVLGMLLLTRPTRTRLGRIVRVDDLVLRPAPGGRMLLQSGAIDRRLRLDQPESATAGHAQDLLARAGELLTPRRSGDHLQAESVTIAARALPEDGLPIVGWTGEPGRSPYAIVAHSGIVLAPALATIAANELLDSRRDPAHARYLPRASPD